MEVPFMYHEFGYNLKKLLEFFAQGGCLENKISQIRSESKWDTMNKQVENCVLLFVQFFKIY